MSELGGWEQTLSSLNGLILADKSLGAGLVLHSRAVIKKDVPGSVLWACMSTLLIRQPNEDKTCNQLFHTGPLFIFYTYQDFIK